MTSGEYSENVQMTSSANDVWGAIFAATKIYPEKLPHFYQSITSTRRDGYSQGSLRKVTYGPGVGFSRAVETAIEEITEVDHVKRTLGVRVTGGKLVPEHYDSFETTVVVTPVGNNPARAAGCHVAWKCEFTNESGSLGQDVMKKFVRDSFGALDNHLQKLSNSGKGKR
ncbi:MLP-like protein 423 [Linum perenne]